MDDGACHLIGPPPCLRCPSAPSQGMEHQQLASTSASTPTVFCKPFLSIPYHPSLFLLILNSLLFFLLIQPRAQVALHSVNPLSPDMDSPSPQGPSAQNSPKPDQAKLAHRPANRKQSSDSSSNTQNAPIPDDKHGADLPMTMSASVVLTSLPRDAHQALADAEAVDRGKGK